MSVLAKFLAPANSLAPDEEARSADAPRARDHGHPVPARARDGTRGPDRARRAAELLRRAHVPATSRGARTRAARAGRRALRLHADSGAARGAALCDLARRRYV